MSSSCSRRIGTIEASATEPCRTSLHFGSVPLVRDKPETLTAMSNNAEPPTTVIPTNETSRFIYDTIVSSSAELRSISQYLSDNPELAFEEFKAHDILCDFLEAEGFATRRRHCLETSFEAFYVHGEGGRTWGFNSEYDALPSIGHACG